MNVVVRLMGKCLYSCTSSFPLTSVRCFSSGRRRAVTSALTFSTRCLLCKPSASRCPALHDAPNKLVSAHTSAALGNRSVKYCYIMCTIVQSLCQLYSVANRTNNVHSVYRHAIIWEVLLLSSVVECTGEAGIYPVVLLSSSSLQFCGWSSSVQCRMALSHTLCLLLPGQSHDRLVCCL